LATPPGRKLLPPYETKDDLLNILIPYFNAGFENNEFCIRIVFWAAWWRRKWSCAHLSGVKRRAAEIFDVAGSHRSGIAPGDARIRKFRKHRS